ncbi:MAG: HlyD family efflux transporter periplasmic adaptor subunit [Leptospiraceae bacterium]|nr:HlyD family efflux transporter periplasmic adaptor subunit [Leptospiraceae bacterium]
MNLRPYLTRRNILYAVAGVFLLTLIYLGIRPDTISVEAAPVVRGAFEETITEDGVTRIREKFTILAPVSGVLQRVTTHPGDEIRSGQPVATIRWDYLRPVQAPAGGRVLRVLREDAGPIEMGTPIMEIGDPGSLEIVLDLLSADAVRARPGDIVRIQRWGGHTALEGKVRLIEPHALTRVSALGVEEQRVNALIDITSPPEEWSTLGDNFRVECTLILTREDNALKIPSGAVFREGDDWGVFYIDDDVARKQRVEILARNPEEVMIDDSLEEGTQVIVYPGDQIQDGVPVEPIE